MSARTGARTGAREARAAGKRLGCAGSAALSGGLQNRRSQVRALSPLSAWLSETAWLSGNLLDKPLIGSAEDGAVSPPERVLEEAFGRMAERRNRRQAQETTASGKAGEAIRADPKQFVVLPLHYTPEAENLVSQSQSYWLVRKHGEAGEFVEKLDPGAR